MIGSIISFLIFAIIAMVVFHGLKMIFASSTWIIFLFFLILAILIAYIIWTERRK